MRVLRGAAGIHHVDLSGELVVRTEPSGRGSGDRRVRVVAREHFGRSDGQFLVRVPDAVVGAGLGEVIASARAGGAFLIDDREEHFRGLIENGGIGVGRADCEASGPVGEHRRPLGQQFAMSVGTGFEGVDESTVVDGNAADDVEGERHLTRLDLTIDRRAKVGGVEIVGGQESVIHSADITHAHKQIGAL